MRDDLFPHSPGFKERGGTSEAAAIVMAESAPALRSRCLRLIAAEPAGLTACEVAARLKWELCSVRARVSELFALGQVRKSGRRQSLQSDRTQAVIWTATPADEVEAEAERVAAAAKARARARAAAVLDEAA